MHDIPLVSSADLDTFKTDHEFPLFLMMSGKRKILQQNVPNLNEKLNIVASEKLLLIRLVRKYQVVKYRN